MKSTWSSPALTSSMPSTVLLKASRNSQGGLFQINCYETATGLSSGINTFLSWTDRLSGQSIRQQISTLSLGNGLSTVQFLGSSPLIDATPTTSFNVTFIPGVSFESSTTVQLLLMPDSEQTPFINDAGFAELTTVSLGASEKRLRVFWRWGTGSLSFQLHKLNADVWNGLFLFYNQVHTSQPILDISQTTKDAVTCSAPGLDIGPEQGVVVYFGVVSKGFVITATPPTGYTYIFSQNVAAVYGIHAADLVWPSGPVPVPSASITLLGSSNNAGVQVAIQPTAMSSLTQTSSVTLPIDTLPGTAVSLDTSVTTTENVTYNVITELESL